MSIFANLFGSKLEDIFIANIGFKRFCNVINIPFKNRDIKAHNVVLAYFFHIFIAF